MSHKGGTSENFVVFGTAFPEPTEKDRRAGRTDSGQFVPSWKQEVRDEHGRRRFHGAFTGGFSAGYFNTVGSKEGWEPSQYVSSRTARNERKEAKPEDFMDEEDLQDLANTQKLVTTDEFDVFGSTERELAARRQWRQQQEERGTGMEVIGDSLINMLGAPRDSVGVRLLRQMGWRPGQGIGPRRRLSDTPQDITVAPRDCPIEDYRVKRDHHGLGYDLTQIPEVAEMKRLRAQQSQTQENRSMFGVYDQSSRNKDAFGLGALEVAEDEDDDIYGTTTMQNYHTSLYEMDDRPVQKQPVLSGRVQFLPARDTNDHIGRYYPPPQVPANFTGIHQTIETKSEKVDQESMFSFEERGRILGEKPIEPRSVFDYMPQHSKDKLNRAIDFFVDLGKDKSRLADFPTVTKEEAILALQGFMPFGDNPQKQARYRHYLENQAGKLSEDGAPLTSLPIPEGMTYESGMKEMDEFAKAARIFRPMSAMMSGRFTSSKEAKQVEVIQFEGGLRTEQEYRKEKEQLAQQIDPVQKPVSQEAEAAAMKMFGALTRTVKPFYPNRLVCKRFNVRNPHPEHTKTDAEASRTQAGSKEALSKESMESMLNKRMPLISESDPLMQAVIPKPSERQEPKEEGTVQEIIEEEEENEENVAPMDYERPSMDIFKAIFDHDSEEEEKEEERQVVEPEDDFIGPPLPPAPATAEIPLITTEPPPPEPFRPMFRRASERKEGGKESNPLKLTSETVIVQPFRSRHSDSDESSDEKSRKRKKKRDESPDERSRKKKKEDRHRHHKKRKRSRSRDKKKHKHSRREESRFRRSFEDELLDAMWVEKEPVQPQKGGGRMRAADLWK
ncbi:hypothetical protein EDC96DRAFT_441313 [Choanephora cucurbitarum]|nr:hypothetical protein EDC96DRAFT_441313 [Choanephora cucurbitarum]